MNKPIIKKIKPLPPLSLIQAISAMTTGDMITESVLQTLQNGFGEYLKGKTLDEAFCIKQTRLRANYGIGERNRFLKLAAKCCCGSGSVGEKAAILSAEIRTFESIMWPKWKDLENPPEGSSSLRIYLFHAKKSWNKIPNERQLIRILKP